MTDSHYPKNPDLVRYVKFLNSRLDEAERALYEPAASVALPLVLIVGCPRSGTTLITQWLAATGAFAYPSNFISRFYKAPVLAYLIQDLVSNPKYEFGDEFSDIRKRIYSHSDLGKTTGFLAPHGFWFFWRRFFHFPDIPDDTYDFDSRADYHGFSGAIANWQAFSQKAIFLKATIANYYFGNIYAKVENVYVIYVERDIHSTTYSLLSARERYSGDRDTWYSYKTCDYEQMLSLPPEEQVTHQYLSINHRIKKQLAEIDESRKIHIDYSVFCRDRTTYENEFRHKIQQSVTFPSLDIRYSACTDDEHIAIIDRYLSTEGA